MGTQNKRRTSPTEIKPLLISRANAAHLLGTYYASHAVFRQCPYGTLAYDVGTSKLTRLENDGLLIPRPY